jgi:preprotein translocase subunit SecG
MKYGKLNKDKGVAGLSVLLSVVAMLFMIGLIVMVFVIAGSRLQTTASDDLNDSDAVDVINDTKLAIGGVTDWFDIFIVLTSLVVLVLLVVIIINSIRGSGLMGQGA